MMTKRKVVLVFSGIFIISMMTACGGWNPGDTISNSSSGTGDTTGSATAVDDVLALNCENHDEDADYSWDSNDVTEIELTGESADIDGSGVAVSGSVVTIISAGTYVLTGTLTDGQIIVESDDDEIVRLVLAGVSISCSSSAPIYIKDAEKTMVVLDENTENTLVDGSSYVFDDPEDPEPNATIFSKDDLTIYGNGSLDLTGNFQDGITSKDGLIITSGTITVTVVDDGIRGKDYTIIKGGTISVTAGGDGIKSDNEDDETKGYVHICGGTMNLVSTGDAMNATTDLLISDGNITIRSGGGSTTRPSTISSKGLKAGLQLVIDDGALSVNSSDDALHSNGILSINSGSLEIASYDDGIHADEALGISDGTINITRSYEGIESKTGIVIDGGTIHLVSSDDGINVASGSGGGGGPGGGGENENCVLYINGGYIVVNASGDGLDCNGAIYMTGGDVIVNGPVSNANAALDHATFKITGGNLVAVGSSGMAQAPSATSTQYSVMLNYRGSFSAGTLFHVQTSSGNNVLSFQPLKNYNSVVFSLPELERGTTYDVYYGGSETGTECDGLFTGGTYTPGTKITTFTINSIVTR